MRTTGSKLVHHSGRLGIGGRQMGTIILLYAVLVLLVSVVCLEAIAIAVHKYYNSEPIECEG